MSMQVSVDGEDVSPEELQSPGWTTAVSRRKVRTVPDGTGEAPSGKPGVATLSQPRQSLTKVKKQVIAASRLPQLPKDHLRVIVRPRNGLDMRNVSQIKFAFALARAAGLGEEEIAEDVVCPNVMQNIAVVSTPAEKNARAYAKISSIAIGNVEYEVNAYMAAPDDTCKGVIRGVDLDIDPARLQALIVHDRNPTALQAKRIKNSKTVVILFDGLKVPNHVICGASMFRCTLFRRQTDVCYACGKVGHRADVCPTPDDVICRGCGKQLPSEEHDCKPTCKLCGGEHVTADRKCQQRFQIPYVVRHRRKERQKQGSNPGFQRGHDGEKDFPPLHTVTPGGTRVIQRGRSRSRGGRSRSRGRSASIARSRSRTPAVRIATQGVDQGSWATKVKKMTKPQVKGGAASEHVSFELVSRIQKENATLRGIVEQLRAEIAEMKGAKVAKATPPSQPNRPVENVGESPTAEVPMDTHSEVRPAKRKATTEHVRNEELDFRVQITDSLTDIKDTLRQMAEAMASLTARTSKLEEEVGKLRAKKRIKTLVKTKAASSEEPDGSPRAELVDISNDGCE